MGRGLQEECDSWDTVSSVITSAAAVVTSASTKKKKKTSHAQCSIGRSVNDKDGSGGVMPCSTCQLQIAARGWSYFCWVSNWRKTFTGFPKVLRLRKCFGTGGSEIFFLFSKDSERAEIQRG